MRYNFKNFPNSNKPIPNYEEAKVYINAIWEWFEGFKKGLQEEIAYLKSMEPEELYDYVHDKKFEKEILG